MRQPRMGRPASISQAIRRCDAKGLIGLPRPCLWRPPLPPSFRPGARVRSGLPPMARATAAGVRKICCGKTRTSRAPVICCQPSGAVVLGLCVVHVHICLANRISLVRRNHLDLCSPASSSSQ